MDNSVENAGASGHSGNGLWSRLGDFGIAVLGLNDPSAPQSTLDGLDYLLVLYRQRALVIALMFVGAMIGLVAGFIVTPQYGAEVVMVPTEDENRGLNAAAGPLSSLGLLAGGAGNEKKETAIALLDARSTIERFINQEHLMPILFADRWNSSIQNWQAGTKPPTMEDGYLKFRGAMTIQDDAINNVIKLRVAWKDSRLASDWANGVVHLVNKTMQGREVERSSRMISYLYEELAKSQNQEVQLHTNIADLIEQQIRTRILALSNDNYALETIDPAQPTKNKVSVGRAVLAIAGLLAGFLIGVPIVFFRHAIKGRKASMDRR